MKTIEMAGDLFAIRKKIIQINHSELMDAKLNDKDLYEEILISSYKHVRDIPNVFTKIKVYDFQVKTIMV